MNISRNQNLRNSGHFILEFPLIQAKLEQYAHSAKTREQLRNLTPYLSERECKQQIADTSAARQILDALGEPPLPFTDKMEEILILCQVGSMLVPEQLLAVATFAASCKRLAAYLQRAENLATHLSAYAYSLQDLGRLQAEIEHCIRGEQVQSHASPALKDIRRKIDTTQSQIKAKLHSTLQKNRKWYSEDFISERNGHYVLPVKKEYRQQFSGTVIETSGSGHTYFMEPTAVTKLSTALSLLQVEEDNEVRRILYTLTAMVSEATPQIKANQEAAEILDFIFAKGKLSQEMKATAVQITTDRRIDLRQGRHPLLDPKTCIPLDLQMGDPVRGVIITGPNTGGKTVALKTVGLLSLMAQCGLHIPAAPGSRLCMHSAYWCDIGDSQSITENLSTFSGHMTQIIQILELADPESLVILDELGSGTDPAEGMGIAIAVLEELRQRGCLFLVTTHYPQVKDYAKSTEAILSARMAFDRETLSPRYRLELGQTGESCALYIAQRLGLPEHLLKLAHQAAYQNNVVFSPALISGLSENADRAPQPPQVSIAKIQKIVEKKPVASLADKFHLGDSVLVFPRKEIGLVFEPTNEQGVVGVQIKGEKHWINHKRLKLHIPAAELYPDDYDFDVVFESVENRKARHQMQKRHQPDLVITHPGKNTPKA